MKYLYFFTAFMFLNGACAQENINRPEKLPKSESKEVENSQKVETTSQAPSNEIKPVEKEEMSGSEVKKVDRSSFDENEFIEKNFIPGPYPESFPVLTSEMTGAQKRELLVNWGKENPNFLLKNK